MVFFLNRKKKKGFTLIESLVLVTIFAIAVLTFYKTYVLVMKYSLETKFRTAAVEFATSEMEILRNTPYEDIILDPKSSPPDGNAVGNTDEGLLYSRTVTINDITHRILTEVYYVDDPEDNDGGDDNPNDYKRVNITVLWGDGINDIADKDHSIKLTSFFVPPSGNESAIENGVISVNVVNSSGEPISGATVSVDDLDLSYSDFINTDLAGNALFEDVPVGQDKYMITVSKSGSEEIQTMSKYPVSSYYPIYVHASVLSGTITTMTIVQDVLPETHIFTKDPYGNEIQNIAFTFSGGRYLGMGTDDNPVYINSNLSATSDINGEVVFDSDVSGYVASIGKYIFALDDEVSNTLWKFDPGSDTEQNAISVESGEYNSDMVIIDNSVDGVIVSVTDSETASPFKCASVKLSRDSSPMYDVTQQTDIYGKAYFPIDADNDGIVDEELDNGSDYDITVNAPICDDTCVSDCNNDCIENSCVEGCVIYQDDCTDYGYSEIVDTDSADSVNGLMNADIELIK